jgi:hypothetical protein
MTMISAAWIGIVRNLTKTLTTTKMKHMIHKHNHPPSMKKQWWLLHLAVTAQHHGAVPPIFMTL